MKKTIITALLVVAIGSAFAQTKQLKKIETQTPLVSVAAGKPVDDSVYKISAPDLGLRVYILSNLLYVLGRGTGDITPNQLKILGRQADSVLRIDNAIYEKLLTSKNKK